MNERSEREWKKLVYFTHYLLSLTASGTHGLASSLKLCLDLFCFSFLFHIYFYLSFLFYFYWLGVWEW